MRLHGEITRTDEFGGAGPLSGNVEVVIERWTAKPPKNDLEKSVGKALDLVKADASCSRAAEKRLGIPLRGSIPQQAKPIGNRTRSSFRVAQRMVPFVVGTESPRQAQGPTTMVKLEDGDTCPECKGDRLNEISPDIVLYGPQGTRLSLPEVQVDPSGSFFSRGLESRKKQKPILRAILPGIVERLGFMEKSVWTICRWIMKLLLSGEAQRIRLANQLGSNLSGVLYVLDEPCIGLHPVTTKTHRIVRDLQAREVVVVEHDRAIMQADRGDIGPGAGRAGAGIVGIQAPRK